jgi:hypothetical protein
MTLSARSAPPAPRPRLFDQVSRSADTRRPASQCESTAPSAPTAEFGRIPVAGDRSACALVTMEFEFDHFFQPYFSVKIPNLNNILKESIAGSKII